MSKGNRRKPERRQISEDMSVFKSYLRRLLQDLKDLKEALKSKDYEKAESMVDRLIDDTQKGIEENKISTRKDGLKDSRPFFVQNRENFCETFTKMWLCNATRNVTVTRGNALESSLSYSLTRIRI